MGILLTTENKQVSFEKGFGMGLMLSDVLEYNSSNCRISLKNNEYAKELDFIFHQNGQSNSIPMTNLPNSEKASLIELVSYACLTSCQLNNAGN